MPTTQDPGNDLDPTVDPVDAAAHGNTDDADDLEAFELQRPPDPIVARGGTYFRVARTVLVVVAIGMGGWFAYDGWVGYPAENARIADLKQQQEALAPGSDAYIEITEQLNELKFHNDTSLRTQQALGVSLPILAVAYFFYFMRKSRGEFRLAGDTLHVPGHGAVKLDEMTDLHVEKWQRKGIADVDFTTADGRSGTFRLDDFIYQGEPTDWIFVEVADKLDPAAAEVERKRLRRRAAKKAGIELSEEDDDEAAEAQNVADDGADDGAEVQDVEAAEREDAADAADAERGTERAAEHDPDAKR